MPSHQGAQRQAAQRSAHSGASSSSKSLRRGRLRRDAERKMQEVDRNGGAPPAGARQRGERGEGLSGAGPVLLDGPRGRPQRHHQGDVQDARAQRNGQVEEGAEMRKIGAGQDRAHPQPRKPAGRGRGQGAGAGRGLGEGARRARQGVVDLRVRTMKGDHDFRGPRLRQAPGQTPVEPAAVGEHGRARVAPPQAPHRAGQVVQGRRLPAAEVDAGPPVPGRQLRLPDARNEPALQAEHAAVLAAAGLPVVVVGRHRVAARHVEAGREIEAADGLVGNGPHRRVPRETPSAPTPNRRAYAAGTPRHFASYGQKRHSGRFARPTPPASPEKSVA